MVRKKPTIKIAKKWLSAITHPYAETLAFD